MAQPIQLPLSPAQQAELLQVRDHDPRPYLRQRAAALLKVAAGSSARAVATHGLLRPRHPDTVAEWVARYRAGGVAGLRVHAGRGRKPAFSPAAAASDQRRRPGGGATVAAPV